jgi:hypothetical protein
VVGAGLLAAQELSRDTAHPTPTAAGE